MNTRRSPNGLTKPLIRATVEATLVVASARRIDLSRYNQLENTAERMRLDGLYRRGVSWSQRAGSTATSSAILRVRAPWLIEVEVMLWHEQSNFIRDWVSYNPLTGRAKPMKPPNE